MDDAVAGDPGLDRALVAAIAAGDPAGLDGAYRRYADRLRAYSRSLTGDGEAAADVVQETFLIAAQRVGQLRDPDRFGGWLYAIARSECLRRARLRRRTVSWADPPEVSTDATDPGRAVQVAQVQALVRAATAGLNSGDREVIELAVRHDLSPAAIGTVLGVSANHAHARVSRARTQLEGALGALLVARAGAGRCEALDALLRDWRGELTPLLRKRINRHVRDCQPCAARRDEWLSPSALLAAYAALPFAAAADLLGRAGGGVPAGGGESQVVAVGPSAVGRAPVGPSVAIGAPPRRRLSRRTATIAASVVVLLLLAAVVAVATRPRIQSPVAAGSPGPVPTEAVSADGGAGLGVASPAPGGSDPGPGTDPGGTDPGGTDPGPGPGGSGSPPAQSPGNLVFIAFTAQAAARVTCDGDSFSLIVGAEATGAQLASAVLYWRSSITKGRSMTVTGQTARRTVHVFSHQVTWWVVARSTDGRSATTPHTVASSPCP